MSIFQECNRANRFIQLLFNNVNLKKKRVCLTFNKITKIVCNNDILNKGKSVYSIVIEGRFSTGFIEPSARFPLHKSILTSCFAV